MWLLVSPGNPAGIGEGWLLSQQCHPFLGARVSTWATTVKVLKAANKQVGVQEGWLPTPTTCGASRETWHFWKWSCLVKF